MALEIAKRSCKYDHRETILYALGTGFGSDPLDTRELRFVHDDYLQASPTMSTVLGWDRSWISRTGICWPLVVHGDQTLSIHRPLPPAAQIIARTPVIELIDKGPTAGAVLRVETSAHEEHTGEPFWTSTSGFFARGDGGFSTKIDKGPRFHPIPNRAPDCAMETSTLPNQALLYGLSGDRNPLHAVPAVAIAAGYPKPILQGLCTYGYACRAVLHAYCMLDPARIAEFDARFSAPVFPGETIRVEMWTDDKTISFRVRAVERDALVLDNGRALLT